MNTETSCFRPRSAANGNSRLSSLAVGLALAAFASSALLAQVTLDPAWRVTPDTTKPGFQWRYFQNNANRPNTDSRTEAALAGQLTDATGALLPNVGDPTAVGAASAEAAAADPTNGVLYFEITNVINLSKTDGGASGYFPGDQLEPGISFTPNTDGQNAEILTYLTLPAGTNWMSMRADDSTKVQSGPNPQDVFGRTTLALRDGGAGEMVFSFVVPPGGAGTYPFRALWANGGGDSHVEWFSVDPDGVSNRKLVNDIPNGGVPAYRATTAVVSPPYVKVVTPSPVPRQTEAASRSVTVVLGDGTTPVNTNNITLTIDGTPAPLTVSKVGSLVTVDTGVLAGLHLPAEAHAAVLTYHDTGSYSRTVSWTFYNLENLILPGSPVTGENFDAYPEATGPANAAPPGWILTNYTWLEKSAIGLGWDLSNQAMDPYTNWCLINTNTGYLMESEILQNNPLQTINGIPVTDRWMSGNCLFAASDGRARHPSDALGNINAEYAPQIQIAVSAPFNLSTVTNPVLTFSSAVRLSGNGEEDALEYSVDNGATWLPALLIFQSSRTFLNSDGSYDAVKMMTNVWPDVAKFPVVQDPDSRDFISYGPLGQKFGDALLTPISAALSPYIVERNDGPASRKVEAIRLPAASKKSQVRLRFHHYGSCGWEWAIDNIAFYDIAPPAVAAPPSFKSISLDGTDVVLTWEGGSGPFLVQGTAALGSTWVDLKTTSSRTARIPRALPMTFFRIQDGTTKSVALFKSVLNGASETPANASPATAIGLLALNGTTASYWLTYSGLSATAAAAHVHGPAAIGVPAGVMFGLTPVGALGTQGVFAGTATVTSLQATDITAGNTYFNIHTSIFPGGEIRGQLLLTP